MTRFPATYPIYREEAEKILREYDSGELVLIDRVKNLGFRGYESPLAYVLSHLEEYQGLSRGGLEKFDKTLYESLRISGQLYKAFPDKNKNK